MASLSFADSTPRASAQGGQRLLPYFTIDRWQFPFQIVGKSSVVVLYRGSKPSPRISLT
jgi:hypothetical protein